MSRAAATVLTLALLLVGGCAALPPNCGERPGDDLSAYVEEVFRRQNRVQSTLMFALPSVQSRDPRAHGRLKAAEGRMQKACTPLNEAARQRQQEGDLGLLATLEAAGAADDCDCATARVEALLKRLDVSLMPAREGPPAEGDSR